MTRPLCGIARLRLSHRPATVQRTWCSGRVRPARPESWGITALFGPYTVAASDLFETAHHREGFPTELQAQAALDALAAAPFNPAQWHCRW